MHQIYSCSDENLEVFTTVISSKCEYIKTVTTATVLSFRWMGCLASGKSLKQAAHLFCRAVLSLQSSARRLFMELICAGASTLWLCKIFALAKLGDLESVLIYL